MNDTQNVIIQNREKITLTGVTDLIEFDDTCVTATTVAGDLRLKGTSLRVARLSPETGELDVDGTLDSLEYTRIPRKKGSFLSRLFR